VTLQLAQVVLQQQGWWQRFGSYLLLFHPHLKQEIERMAQQSGVNTEYDWQPWLEAFGPANGFHQLFRILGPAEAGKVIIQELGPVEAGRLMSQVLGPAEAISYRKVSVFSYYALLSTSPRFRAPESGHCDNNRLRSSADRSSRFDRSSLSSQCSGPGPVWLESQGHLRPGRK
jgi:hypothetical protein